jgi:hypothetical protein
MRRFDVYKAVHNSDQNTAVVLDDAGRNIAFIHSDGKTMTPAFSPELAALLADLLNMNEEAAKLECIDGRIE